MPDKVNVNLVAVYRYYEDLTVVTPQAIWVFIPSNVPSEMVSHWRNIPEYIKHTPYRIIIL